MTHDDYLWDGSGRPDPDVQRLERLLASHRYRPARSKRIGVPLRLVAGLAAAAVLLLVWQYALRPEMQEVPSGWRVETLTGAPCLAATAIRQAADASEGEWLVTDDTSAAVIWVSDIGRVRVAPNSRLQIVATDSTNHRMKLERGTLHVSIWAPPRLFFVETPAAVAVDLGCIYTITVDRDGNGTLCVESGWVALEWDGRESLVPEGALCDIRMGAGPGTPYLAGASLDYLDYLERYDLDPGTGEYLDRLIHEADVCDVFSLVYLLPRVPSEARSRIFDRVSSFVPPWPGITRDGIANLDLAMVEEWQDQFACFELEPCRATCDAVLPKVHAPAEPL